MAKKHFIQFLSVGAHTLVVYSPACRHVPTCSEYSQNAVEQHGWWRGTILSIQRLWRCRPGGTSGWDPVPSR